MMTQCEIETLLPSFTISTYCQLSNLHLSGEYLVIRVNENRHRHIKFI